MPTAVILGAGPAGLTAALELQRRTGVRPVIVERDHILGGISRTDVHEGNRIDIGGHRFFSKSDVVMKWWLDILPLERGAESHQLLYRGGSRALEPAGEDGPDPDETDRVMLVRPRKSRILWRGQLLDYPLSMSAKTIRQIGALDMAQAIAGYGRAVAWPRPERTLEDFLINRFGVHLYRCFFESYTEKVWGVPCREIDADWGAQRIKGLDIKKAVLHALDAARGAKGRAVETSLIERFLYPKLGPGQLWEEVGRRVLANGGEILLGAEAVGMHVSDGRIRAVTVRTADGQQRELPADFVLSSAALPDVARMLGAELPPSATEVAAGLAFRDFFTVGVLVDELSLRSPDGGAVRDNWIYVQEPHVRMGRIQLFNNWSPWMVAGRSKMWLGLEYFCFAGDELWSRPDSALIDLAVEELSSLRLAQRQHVRSCCVIRMRRTYPAYWGTYGRIGELRDSLDRFGNLFCIGRNGQHHYNNQDHSMLTALEAVELIRTGSQGRSRLWNVNTEQQYHEEKSG